MSIFTSKNIVITPGFNGSLATSFSQIDFKWYDAGIGTFKFLRSPLDIRATIYNWQENGEPSLVFGGLGSFLGSTYFAGPYNDINGTYTGFTTTPSVRILPLSGRIFANQVYSNFIIDSLGSSGAVGQFLSRSSNGITWSAIPSGILTGSGITGYYALFNGIDQLTVGNITDDGSNIIVYAAVQFQETVDFLNSTTFSEIETANINISGQLSLNGSSGTLNQILSSNGSAPIWTSQVPSSFLFGNISSAIISGHYTNITKVGTLSDLTVGGLVSAGSFEGNGGFLSDLDASQLTSGTVPSSAISGNYSGITSVGTLSQLRITGITTISDTFLSGRLYASGNPGLANSVLVSTGTGIAWSTLPSITLPTGIITGTGIANALPRFLTPSSIGTSSILDNGVAVTVNSDVFFLGLSQFNGDIEALGGIEATDYIWAKNSFELDGPFFDVDDSPGVSGQVLVSLGTSVRWVNASASGGLTGFGATNFITKFIGTSVVTNSSITDNGITVGVNTNFSVSGISTLSTTFLTGRLFVGGNPGLANSVLVSTGSGIAWTSMQTASLPVGVITGSGLAGYYALFNGTDQLTVGNITDDGSSIVVYAAVQFQETADFLNTSTFSEIETTNINIAGQLSLNGNSGTLNQILSSNGSAPIWTSQVPSSFLFGNISSSVISGHYTNITKVGTLNDLTVSGLVSAGSFEGNGGFLSDLDASQLTSGTVPTSAISGNYSGITSVGTLSQLQVTGISSAGQFFGNGSNLTNLNATNLSDGTVPSARVTGSYSGITSVGTLSQLRVTGITTVSDSFFSGRLYASGNPGLANSVLVSTGSGIAWTSMQSASLPVGIITGTGIVNALPRFLTPSSIGTSSILDNGVAVTVNSDVFFLGLSQFNGDIEALGGIEATDYIWAKNSFELDGPFFDVDDSPGVSGQVLVSLGTSVRWTNASASGGLTGFGATNFITKFIGTSVVASSSITDNGITVGVNTNLTVSGISTLSTTFLTGRLYASGNPGLANSVLVSTGSGIAWTSMQSASLPVGIITGTGVNVDRIAKFITPNQIVDSNLTDDGGTILSLIPFESSSITAFDVLQVGGFLYDVNTSAGSANQILSSNGSNVVWTSQVPSSFLFGNISSSVISGHYTNITKVGTLTDLTVGGLVSAGSFEGNGGFLSDLDASQLTSGTVPSSAISGNYSGITSVGTLSQLRITGITTSGQFFGNGSNLTNLNATNLSDGTVPSARVTGSYSGITSVGTLAQLRVTGISTATQFFGNGSNLTNLNASNLSDGTVPSSRISGSYSGITSVGALPQLQVNGITSSLQFFGNGSNLTNLNAANLSDGIIPSARISGSYSGITSVGTLAQLRVTGITTSTQFFGNGSNLTNINASNLSDGTVPSTVVTGSYAGITSLGSLTQLRVTGISTISDTFLSGRLYASGSPGFANSVLVSTGTGIAWSSAQAASLPVGIITGTGANVDRIAKFIAPNQIVDSNLSDDGIIILAIIPFEASSITAFDVLQVGGFLYDSNASEGSPTQILSSTGSNVIWTSQINSSFLTGNIPSAVITGSYSGITSVGTLSQLRITGITTSGQFFGNGSNLTNLNATNLSDGIIPSARISGSYSGITSVGTLSQLRITGITTVSDSFFSGRLYASGNPGLANSVLVSTGTGIAWSSVQSSSLPVGIITGNGGSFPDRIAKFITPDQIIEANISDDGSTIISLLPFETATATVTDLLQINGFLYDVNTSAGSANQILSSNGSNVVWTSQVPSSFLFGNISSSVISGHYTNITKVGTLNDLTVSGLVSAGSFEGNGSALSDLDAGQLTSGTVPSSAISGNYSGITSVGTLSQLRVTGITTVSDSFFSGRLYASGNPGLANSVLVSTGTGIAWSSVQSSSSVTITRSITFIFGDGVNVLSTGFSGYLPACPFSGTITSWSLVADVSGSVEIDIWKHTGIPTVANTIVAAAPPSLSASQLATSSSLTGWTVAVNEGDLFGFNVNSASSIKRLTLVLKIVQ